MLSCHAGKTFVLKNPANGDKVGEIQCATEQDVEDAVVAAEKAQPTWAALAAHERGAKLMKFAALVREHAGTLGELDALAMGRPVSTNYDSMIAGVSPCLFSSGAHTSAAGAIEYAAGLGAVSLQPLQ